MVGAANIYDIIQEMKAVMKPISKKGQLMLEALLAIAFAAIVVGLGSTIIVASFRGSQGALEKDIATNVLEEGFNAVKAASVGKWLDLYYPPTNTGSQDYSLPDNYYSIYQSDSTNAFSWTDYTPGTSFIPGESSTKWGTGVTIKGASASSPRNLWVAGTSGKLFRWNGASWFDKSVSGVTFNDIGVISQTQVIAVGDAGKRYSYNATTGVMDSYDPVTILDLNAVSAPSKESVWAVGDASTGGSPAAVIRLGAIDGTWAAPSGTPAISTDLYAVSAIVETDNANCSAAVMGGAAGVVKTTRPPSCGTYAWTSHTPGDSLTRWGNNTTINGVSMVAAHDGSSSAWTSDIWVAGTGGQVWRCTLNCFGEGTATWTRYCGTGTWNSSTNTCSATPVLWGTTTINEITAFASDLVFIVGEDGKAWRYDGISWTDLTPAAGTRWCNPTCLSIADVSDRFSTDVWMVGASGIAWNLSPTRFIVQTSSTTPNTDSSNIVTVNGVDYHRYLYIQNVCRNDTTKNITGITTSSGTTTTCASGTQDPSTLKINMIVNWAGGEVSSSDYITRWKNVACLQTTWTEANSTTSAEACPTTRYDLTNTSNDGAGNKVNRGEALTISATTSDAHLSSNIMDTTGASSITKPYGAAINSIMWKGTKSGGVVRFRVAASNCLNGHATGSEEEEGNCAGGSWAFKGGAECDSSHWFQPSDQAIPVELKCLSSFNNKRYVRYYIDICAASNCTSALGTGTSPSVTDVIINWAP